jgi:hypothetical protein
MSNERRPQVSEAPAQRWQDTRLGRLIRAWDGAVNAVNRSEGGAAECRAADEAQEVLAAACFEFERGAHAYGTGQRERKWRVGGEAGIACEPSSDRDPAEKGRVRAPESPLGYVVEVDPPCSQYKQKKASGSRRSRWSAPVKVTLDSYDDWGHVGGSAQSSAGGSGRKPTGSSRRSPQPAEGRRTMSERMRDPECAYDLLYDAAALALKTGASPDEIATKCRMWLHENGIEVIVRAAHPVESAQQDEPSDELERLMCDVERRAWGLSGDGDLSPEALQESLDALREHLRAPDVSMFDELLSDLVASVPTGLVATAEYRRALKACSDAYRLARLSGQHPVSERIDELRLAYVQQSNTNRELLEINERYRRQASRAASMESIDPEEEAIAFAQAIWNELAAMDDSPIMNTDPVVCATPKDLYAAVRATLETVTPVSEQPAGGHLAGALLGLLADKEDGINPHIIPANDTDSLTVFTVRRKQHDGDESAVVLSMTEWIEIEKTLRAVASSLSDKGSAQ